MVGYKMIELEYEESIRLMEECLDQENQLTIKQILTEYVLYKDEIKLTLEEYKNEIEPINNKVKFLLEQKKKLYESKYKDFLAQSNKYCEAQGRLAVKCFDDSKKGIEIDNAIVHKSVKTYVYVSNSVKLAEELVYHGSKVIASAVKTFDRVYLTKMYELGLIDKGLKKIKKNFIRIVKFKDL